MHSVAALAVYIPFSAITAAIFGIELFRRFKRHEDYLFTVLCLCIAFWFSFEIAALWATELITIKYLANIKLIFVGFVPPILLLFVLRFYKVDLGPYAKRARWLLYLIPCGNILMAATAGLHSWMIDIQVIAMASPIQYDYVWGPWFWVHTVYSYIISVLIIVVVVIRHFRLPRFYRLPSTLMSMGILITLLGNVVTLLQILPPFIDITLISCSLSMILFDLAIINNNKSKFVRFSHKHIYHFLSEYILILDDTQRVLEWNRPAEAWFSSQGVTLKDRTLSEVLESLMSREGAFQKQLEDQDGINLYLLSGDFPMVFYIELHDITDANNDIIGSIAVFSDITKTWLLIERLEEKAGMDSLTGIPNHMAYTGALNRLNQPEHLPLSVIVCDANNLKTVNDSLGHQYGDLLLKLLAECLEKVCAKEHFAARTGGDEFICLLPNTSTEGALEVVVQIRERLAMHKQYPFALSAALGVATKNFDHEEIDEIIAKADSLMYQDKKRLKERLKTTQAQEPL